MTQIQTRNPFIAQIQGTSAASTPSSDIITPPDSSPNDIRDAPPTSPSTSTTSPQPVSAMAAQTRDALTEELPPAYTPIADSRQGEQSVEFGPARPFQQVPAPGSRPWGVRQQAAAPVWYRPASSGWQTGWGGGYPGQIHRSATTAMHARTPSAGVSVHIPPPPPQHPSISPTRDLFPTFAPPQRRASYAAPAGPPPLRTSNHHLVPPPLPPNHPPAPPPRPTSDFVRDFYTAGPDDTDLMGGTSDQYGGPASPTSPRGPRPVTPPRPTTNGNSPTTATNGADVPDDGRPTNTPVPGHPLLYNGKVLVYSAGYECPKCINTGYKHYDPSHPCTKCWAKFGKPYTGTVTYAPWSAMGNVTPSQAGLNLQRPLRTLQSPAYPPPPPPPAPSTHYPPPPMHTALSRSNTMYASPPPPPDASPYAGPSSQYTTYAYAPPPPGSLVVQPGDPRIGGRLCWRCNGSGTVSLFFFDQQTCDVCDGAGRILR